jgi:hypothetical protein
LVEVVEMIEENDMQVYDPGHSHGLHRLDGGGANETLTFIKRFLPPEGERDAD